MPDNSLIIAHRGESYDAPENTMASINLAWERGAEAVEIDVHLSKDDHVVVIHDFNTKRLAGDNLKISKATLEELKKLDVGSWKGDKWQGEQIPTLKEVLKTIPQGKKLIIEIKSNADIIPTLKQDIESSCLETMQIEIIGFDLETMALAKRTFTDHKVLWLLDLDYYWYTRILKPSIKKAISKSKRHGLDGLNVWAGNMLDKSMIRKVHDAGLLLYCWTVDDMEHARKLWNWGIDGITTNRAAWMNEKFSLSK